MGLRLLFSRTLSRPIRRARECCQIEETETGHCHLIITDQYFCVRWSLQCIRESHLFPPIFGPATKDCGDELWWCAKTTNSTIHGLANYVPHWTRYEIWVYSEFLFLLRSGQKYRNPSPLSWFSVAAFFCRPVPLKKDSCFVEILADIHGSRKAGEQAREFLQFLDN